MTVFLMNIETGNVDTEENWLIEKESWETTEFGKTANEQFNSLLEVVKNNEGDWIEADA